MHSIALQKSYFAPRLQPSEAPSAALAVCVQTGKDKAIVVMECEYETVPKLSNSTISNDLE